MTFFGNSNERKATWMKTGKRAKAALCILLACPCAACAKTITLPDLGDFAAGRDGDMQIEIYVNEPLRRY